MSEDNVALATEADLVDVDVVEEEPAPRAGSPARRSTAPGDDRAQASRMPIETLGQVELKVEVVLGRARLRLHELLDVRPGQSLELDRARNSPVDVLVNGTLFARGDIVVIDDTNLGVRVSEVIGADIARDAR
ncbi:MAG TPA: FliM/FliN family flagellar motor switch protein [Acidimicrobiales bacterium]|nr:FliM/FliN family flagellar motor switch protein [Acidimicrobiales bacterium]